MQAIIDFIVESIALLRYIGIFLMMLLESSFVPFSGEVLGAQGSANLLLSVLWGIWDSIAGALVNYYLALAFGRKALLEYGCYFMFEESHMIRM